MSRRKSQNLEDIQELNAQILISIKDNEEEESKIYPQLTNNSSLTQSKNIINDSISDVIIGLKQTRFSMRQDQVTQNSRATFSALNDSVNQSCFKSKLGSKISLSNQNQNSKEMKLFNQSLFTQRRQMQQSIRAKPAPHIQEEFVPPVNYQQSFYLTKKQESLNDKNQSKTGKEPDNQIKVIFRTTKYFIQLGTESIEVNSQSLQDLYNQLFKRQIFVPLFSYQIYDKWNQIYEKDKKYNQSSQLFIYLKIYLDKYIKYLNQQCLKQMQEVLKTVKMIQQGSRDKKKQAISYFQLDLKSLVDNVKHFIAQTKTEVLRRTLLAKIKSMVEALKEGDIYKLSADQKLNLQKTMQKTWIQLGNVQLLLSFERTIVYCNKKIENSPQTKFKQIWIKYREIMNGEHSKFVSKVDLIYL